MRSSYKKLGTYIREVSGRNGNLQVNNLLGVSITKEFIPSIANTIGTDMTTYKVVKTGQFAYGPVTSRNGDKISVALLKGNDCIISQAYTVFEIIDHNKLDPEYLMMWFRRPEFDRYARFMSHGSVREIFGWEEMCGVELPIPSIEKQREIVREYNVVTDRIKLNERMNQKLEETAQAIYKQWFVDFEFPMTKEYAASIGKSELEGKPYKSSGGEMLFCKELEKEIPKEWKASRLGELAIVSAGGDKPKKFSDYQTNECPIPIYSNGTFNEGLFGFTDRAKVKENCITISARGGIGFTALRLNSFVPIVRLIVVTPKKEVFLNYLFETAKRFQYQSGIDSAQSQLTVPEISSYWLVEPDFSTVIQYQHLTSSLYKMLHIKKRHGIAFDLLLNSLNSKMAKVAA